MKSPNSGEVRVSIDHFLSPNKVSSTGIGLLTKGVERDKCTERLKKVKF